VREAKRVAGIANHAAVGLIALKPTLGMFRCGQHSPLGAIAGRMSQHEIMAKIHRIVRPRNEMVYVGAPGASTVWIVDDDLGFVCWLGEIFTEARCQALPALSCEHALSLMKGLDLGADLIVVNPHLPGVSAMLQTLSHANRCLKVVSIQNHSEPHVTAVKSQATLERPSGSDPISRPEWLKRVRKLLMQVKPRPKFER